MMTPSNILGNSFFKIASYEQYDRVGKDEAFGKLSSWRGANNRFVLLSDSLIPQFSIDFDANYPGEPTDHARRLDRRVHFGQLQEILPVMVMASWIPFGMTGKFRGGFNGGSPIAVSLIEFYMGREDGRTSDAAAGAANIVEEFREEIDRLES